MFNVVYGFADSRVWVTQAGTLPLLLMHLREHLRAVSRGLEKWAVSLHIYAAVTAARRFLSSKSQTHKYACAQTQMIHLINTGTKVWGRVA